MKTYPKPKYGVIKKTDSGWISGLIDAYNKKIFWNNSVYFYDEIPKEFNPKYGHILIKSDRQYKDFDIVRKNINNAGVIRAEIKPK